MGSDWPPGEHQRTKPAAMVTVMSFVEINHMKELWTTLHW